MTMQSGNSPTIQLPPGVSVIGSRETSQSGPTGLVQQGMVFTVQLPSGTPTSVFVPYSLMGQTDAVAAAIAERVNQILAIERLSS